jgi:hypothetical protein
MLKRLSVIALLAIFLLSSITVVAKVATNQSNGSQGNYIDRKDNLGKVNLFDRSVADDLSGPVNLRSSGAPPFPYTPVANWRQVYELNTTQQDRQHYTSPGRQVVYAGYFNASCNYVYMDYAYRTQVGATVINNVQFAVFDWNTPHQWDQTVGGSATVSPSGRYWSPNVDATPDNGSSVVMFYSRNEQQPWYTEIGYSDQCAPAIAFAHTNDTLPGSPNLDGIVTGYCDDSEGSQVNSPYLWPIVDVDTIGDQVITHVAYTEWGFCDDVPTDDIDASSLVYARKISDAGVAHTGTWDGPYFMDSVYNIAHIVRADKRPGHHEVYYAYLKPMYYQNGSSCPCAGTGHYQLSSEVVYKVSDNDGAPGSWSAPISITDYISGFQEGRTEPAVYEISAMVDPTGVFHVVWLSANRDPDNYCGALLACRMWHWDNSNNCISMAYDASHPAYIPGGSDVGAWNWMVAKPNISWCDSKLYLLFTRFGTHTDPEDDDLASDLGHNDFLNGDLMVVCSDASGGMGQVWTDGFNLTDTETDGCAAGECMSEHWPTMAMYASDSLMIQYILDLEPGAKGGVNEADLCVWTDNPVIFMTWPCFSMADMDANICVATSPTDLVYDEVPLAPNGVTAGCNTEATYSADVTLSNCGNVNLSYTTSSDATWLTITSGDEGDILAGTGPRGSDHVDWDGASGCASPATITWEASSATLPAGGYTGNITVDLDDPSADDLIIEVNLVVACLYYLPEFATITGGCWEIDLWSTPKAGNGIENDGAGNMTYYACGGDSTYAPLYLEAVVIGWKEGGKIKLFGDAITQDSSKLYFRALDSLIIDSVGNPSSGQGYYHTLGSWSTPGDSVIKGTIEFFLPGHQDTAVLIERVTLTNTGSVALSEFLVGEEIDWDCDLDSSIDAGGVEESYQLIYQHGDHNYDSLVAGCMPYFGQDAHYGAAAINGYDYAFETLGWFPDTLYNYLAGLDDTYEIFTDSLNGTEMRTIHRFWEGTLAPGKTLTFCKIKAISLDGVSGLLELMDNAMVFMLNHELCQPPECQGICGDANGDATVNVSDAVYIINYVFVGGGAPSPLACGDANSDGTVNVSDAVYIINYVFVGGGAPGDCNPGSVNWEDGDCCPFE